MVIDGRAPPDPPVPLPVIDDEEEDPESLVNPPGNELVCWIAEELEAVPPSLLPELPKEDNWPADPIKPDPLALSSIEEPAVLEQGKSVITTPSGLLVGRLVSLTTPDILKGNPRARCIFVACRWVVGFH